MNYETCKQFSKFDYVYLRLKSGFFYKAKIKKVTHDSIIITDKYSKTYVISIDSIEALAEWSSDRSSQ